MTFTWQELKDFILAQPDDRKINFKQSTIKNKNDCGCLLVHFGLSKTQDWNEIDCTFRSIRFNLNGQSPNYLDPKTPSDSNSIASFIFDACKKFNRPTTYKKVKQLLAEYEKTL